MEDYSNEQGNSSRRALACPLDLRSLVTPKELETHEAHEAPRIFSQQSAMPADAQRQAQSIAGVVLGIQSNKLTIALTVGDVSPKPAQNFAQQQSPGQSATINMVLPLSRGDNISMAHQEDDAEISPPVLAGSPPLFTYNS